VPYWACAHIQPQRARLALYFLGLSGFTTYYPQIRMIRPARPDGAAPLFTGYAFVEIESQWHQVEHTPGVHAVVKHDGRPAKVTDQVIDDLRAREVNGLIELPRPPPLRPGAKVRITRGAFADRIAIYAGMKPRQRIEILLGLLGGERHLVIARSAVMPAP
jgi:transcription antitermination factor NusG